MAGVVGQWIEEFHPRAPRGARQTAEGSLGKSQCFNPRAPRGARPPLAGNLAGYRGFNPRAPRGARAGFKADRHGVRNLTLVYKCAPEGARMGEILQAMLRRVGIEVRIRSNEWATFYDDMQRGNFDIAAMPWIGIRDPHHYYMVFDSR